MHASNIISYMYYVVYTMFHGVMFLPGLRCHHCMCRSEHTCSTSSMETCACSFNKITKSNACLHVLMRKSFGSSDTGDWIMIKQCMIIKHII